MNSVLKEDVQANGDRVAVGQKGMVRVTVRKIAPVPVLTVVVVETDQAVVLKVADPADQVVEAPEAEDLVVLADPVDKVADRA